MSRLKIALVGLGFVIVGGLTTFAQQMPLSNIGFIDEAIVIKNYPQTKAIEEKQKNQIIELQKLAADARFQIASAKTDQEKKQLEETLTKQINQKKNSLDEEYAKMYSNLQKDIISIVKDTADKKNLAVVLKKDSVIYGGTDITQDIIKSFNK